MDPCRRCKCPDQRPGGIEHDISELRGPSAEPQLRELDGQGHEEARQGCPWPRSRSRDQNNQEPQRHEEEEIGRSFDVGVPDKTEAMALAPHEQSAEGPAHGGIDGTHPKADGT
ncbi:hypothetical protein GCM10009583_31420 [Ornithinicoccus hortensis]